MADAFASADSCSRRAISSRRCRGPTRQKTFTPGGFVPSEAHPSASAPVCAPGFSLLLAPFIAIGGFDAIFPLTPIAGALLVWLTFVAGRAMAGPLAGAMAAVLVAASPPMLYQVVQPMNDVTTAALWMATFAGAAAQAVGARRASVAVSRCSSGRTCSRSRVRRRASLLSGTRDCGIRA